MKILMGCKSLHTLLLTGSFDRKAMPTDDDMVDFHGFQNLCFLSLVKCGLTGQITGLIDLSVNNINGSIPTEISQLQLLCELYLHSNNISSDILNQISNLIYLENLNLSTDNLSGKIPSFMTSLNFLSVFSVLYNNLQGQIPTSTQLQSFNDSSFEGNPKLCGAPLPNECREIDQENKNNVYQYADNECDELP
nr:receptor-like protein 2 [Malus domestica]